MVGMCMTQSIQLTQSLVLRQVLIQADLIKPFLTDEEKRQRVQYEVLEELSKRVNQDEFIDPEHFSMEVDRNTISHPFGDKSGGFARDLTELVRDYQSDEQTVQRILKVLGAEREWEEEKDLPGEIASSWRKLTNYLEEETTDRQLLNFLELLREKKATVSGSTALITQAADLGNQKALVRTSLEKVQDYVQHDTRMLPFAQSVISPVLRSLDKERTLTSEEATKLYEDIVESLYMLDREQRIPGITEKISSSIKEEGLSEFLQERTLPFPMHVALKTVSTDQASYEGVASLCEDSAFRQGREIKRDIYRGLSALEGTYEANRIITHMATHATNAKSLAKMLSTFSLVCRDPDFKYSFATRSEEGILRNLKLQLVDKSIKRLRLDDDSLEQYLDRIDTDQRFARIGNIITTLAGYSHYQNPQQIGLLREIVEVELAGNFPEWRYTHNKAGEQLRVLGKDTEAWRNNSQVTRFVGELNALQSHIDAIKNILPKIYQTYQEHYQLEFGEINEEELEREIAENEEALRKGGLKKSERKELGYRTHLLREELSYHQLISSLSDLNTENYENVLKAAEVLAKRKSRNPLYESAVWIRETLDQPVYREARRITVTETDELETLLRMGEIPVPHCQSWKNNSSLNSSLLSFVADANKKLYHISNGNDRPMSMSMVRLVEWEGTPTLLVENIYANEWSEEYGIALLGSLADKALAIYEDTGKEVRIAIPGSSGHDCHDTNIQVSSALKKFGEKYKVEIFEERLYTNPAESKNQGEYWDCGPGMKDSGATVCLDVQYIRFGGEE